MKITKNQLKRIVEQSLRYDMGSESGDEVIASHPNANELLALSSVFTVQVLPEDVPYILYSKGSRKGQPYIYLEDREQQLGHMTTSLTEDDAMSHGTTVADIVDFLQSHGAQRKKIRRRPKPSYFSYYD